MSLIKAQIWLPILSFYELTSLIIPLSIEGVDLHTTSVCTEGLMICLHQINAAY